MSYQASLAIRERLAKDDPGNSVWQRDLFICHQRIGDVQLARGDARAALAGYRASLEIVARLAGADPGNAGWQEDLSASYVKAGDILLAYGNLATALTSYQSSLAIQQRLAQADPGNARWQRGLISSYVKVSEVSGDKTYAARALDVALDMQRRGIAGAARRLDDRRLEAARTPMSEVFVSYKREDEARVGRLVQALESTGLSVWWDRGLAGGESWRTQIQTALDAAKCVIVVWTRESVGPAGDFVRDEAGQAKRRGVLVPVLLDKVDPPLGFGEIQAIDLTRWKGNPRDPFFQDLRAAVAAKLEGRAVPPAKGPMKRLVRRLTLSSVASVIGLGLVFGFNLFSAQDQVCGLPLFQPQISDVCGALGIGNRPSKTERVAWASLERGSCAALRTHVERFPQGAYRAAAADMLAARRVTQKENWTPGTRRLALYVGQDDAAFSNGAAAQAAALARGQVAAERLCKSFATTTSFRFTSATPAVQTWNCSPVAKGVTCGFEGEAVCAVEERRVQEFEACGG